MRYFRFVKSAGLALMCFLLLFFLHETPSALADMDKPFVVFSVGKMSYVVNDHAKSMDASPFIENGRVYVPLRYLAISLGMEEEGIKWDPAKRHVTLSNGKDDITLIIDSKIMYVNNEPVQIEVAPLVKDGRCYLPARYIAEALGYCVNWDDSTRSVIIKETSELSDTGELISSNIDRGELFLFHQNYSMINHVPNNVFVASPVGEMKATISPKFAGSAINMTSRKGETGEVYISGLSPHPYSIYKLKCAYNTDGRSSVGYLSIANLLIGLQQGLDGKGRILGYYKTSNGLEYRTMTIDSGIKEMFELIISTDPANKSALVKYNAGGEARSMEIPFFDPGIRDLPYKVFNPGFIRIYHWLSSDSSYSTLDIYEVSQTTHRKLITVVAPNNLQPFGLDGPHSLTTVAKGIDYLSKNKFSGTLWLDVGAEWTRNQEVRAILRDLVREKGWDVGIHYSRRLNDLPFEDAVELMKKEYNYVLNNFGYAPSSWCSLQNSDNVALARWAYENLNMIWRNDSSGINLLPNVGNLHNSTWKWWEKTLGLGMIYPTFTHETDIEPAIPYSIDYSMFTQWVDSYKDANCQIIGFSKWWKINSNVFEAGFDNVYADSNKLIFTAHTNGESAFVNVDFPCIKVIDLTSNREINWTGGIRRSAYFYIEDGHKYCLTKR